MFWVAFCTLSTGSSIYYRQLLHGSQLKGYFWQFVNRILILLENLNWFHRSSSFLRLCKTNHFGRKKTGL